MEQASITQRAVLLLFIFLSAYAAGQISKKVLTNEELLEWEAPAELKAKYPYFLSGYDNEGSPVYVWEYGKWDLRSAAEAGKNATEQLERLISQMVLRWKQDGVQAPEKAGTVVIANAEGFNLRQATHVGVIRFLVGSFKKMADINRPPGGIKRLYNVNTNYLVRHLFRISRRQLGSVANVTELHDTDVTKWMSELLQTIPVDQLPRRYGGREDHEPVKTFR